MLYKCNFTNTDCLFEIHYKHIFQLIVLYILQSSKNINASISMCFFIWDSVFFYAL